MKSITLHVTGMTCGGCVKSVTRVLEELNGVEKAVVTLDDGKAVITFDESAVSIAQLIETIEDAGFLCNRIKKIAIQIEGNDLPILC